MKVLVIGAGSAGKRHHENLAALGADSTLMPYSEFADGGGGAPNETRVRGWDGAVIATSTHIRLEVVRPLAAAGVPLYIEKPLAVRAADVLEIVDAAKDIASRSMVGFMMRYHPAFRYLGDTDLTGIYRFSFEIGHDVRRWRPGRRFAGSYGARPDGGGVLLDLCHELDMASFLFPRANELSVRCLGHDDYPGVDFCTSVALSGPSAPLGNVFMDYLSPMYIRRVTLRGTDASFEFDLAADFYLRDAGNGPVNVPLRCERNELFLAAMRDFLNLIAGRPVNDLRYVPRLDLAADSCMLIARAWDAREFIGTIAGDFA